MEDVEAKPKRVRGKGTKQAMVLTSLRLPTHVFEYYRTFPNMQKAIREVLEANIKPTEGEVNE
jgi:hypothetical protein